MQDIPLFVPREPSILEIEVIPNDAEQTFETNLRCSRKHCGTIVSVDSDGPKTIQSVSCPNHGFLVSFPDRRSLGEFIRFSANQILAATGHELIEDDAGSVFGDHKVQLPHSVN